MIDEKNRIDIEAVRPTGDVDPTTDGDIETNESISHADGLDLTAMFRSKAWSIWQDLLLKKLQSDTRRIMIDPAMDDTTAFKHSGAWLGYETRNALAAAIISQTEAITAELEKKRNSQK